MLGQIMCGNLTGLVSTFYLHVYFRCLTSLFCAFMYTAGQVICKWVLEIMNLPWVYHTPASLIR